MANERTVPLLPCASVDEIAVFYTALGFRTTYRQMRPNPYVALVREDLDLHYFGMEGFRPEDSYGSCLVLVDDTGPLFEAFAAGLRQLYGRLPIAGFPRITRPRARANAGGLSGFSLVDPSGNWIRVLRREGGPGPAEPSRTATSRLGRAYENAVVLADSKGDVEQAAKVLAGAVARAERDGPSGQAASDPTEEEQAREFLAELQERLRQS